MNREKIIVLIVSAISICGLGIISYTSYINAHQTNENMITCNESNNSEYDYSTNSIMTDKKSEIIRNVNTSSRIVALSFEGMDDEENMQGILELLDKYNIKATFVVSGIDAAENPEIVKKIKEEGHEIGNASLDDKNNLQEKSKEELIRDFSKSNKILEDIINDKVRLLKCKAVEYTDDFLEAAYASGDEYILDSNIYLNYQSFKSFEEAYGYISRLKNGSVLSIKLNGVLDETEYSKKTDDDNRAIDKQAGIKEKDDLEKQQITTLQMLEWLLRSISQNRRAVVKVTDLACIEPDNDWISDNYTIGNGNLYRDRGTVANKTNKSLITDVNKQLNNKKNDEKNDQKNDVPDKSPQKENSDNKDEVNLNDIDFKKLIENNNKKLAEVNSQIYTTKNSVSYTFKGLSNEQALDYVLESLKKINGKGTFFVTKEEIENYPERINKIIEYGNEVGNGGITNSSKLLSKSSEDIAKEIYEVDVMLKNRGIKTNAYMPGYGYVNENVEEALSSLKSLDDFKDYELFTYTKSPVISKYKNWNPEKIVPDYFNINTYLSLRKGEVVYFRLDSNLFDDNMTVGNMLKIITKNYVENGYVHQFNSKNNLYEPIQRKLGYSVVSLKELQDIENKNTQRYNLNKNKVVLTQRTREQADTLIQKNYIGNIYVDLNGFTEKEQSEMDSEGFINTNGESAIFFTFDDWGSDLIINEILDVLDKHNVKATFFVLGKYVDIDSDISNSNPNLLRTIALKGHDIGSHTYDHDKLDTNPEDFRISLNNSYSVMYRIIGDLGTLKPYLRPPTLYTSKSGLETAFQCGFDYVINGNISTHDYEASSSEELLSGLESELVKNKGNVVVMHMNNQASYTPEVLDKFLTKNEQGLYGDKYKIARISDYLK